MARLVNSKQTTYIKTVISTVFADGSIQDKEIGIGDIVTNLRYVLNGTIAKVSGKVTDIKYSAVINNYNGTRDNYADNTATDITLKYLVIDASEQYNAKTITVPFEEIIEDEGVEDVIRMKYTPKLVLDMEMYYSNCSTTNSTIEVGDRLDNVRIMNPETPGDDITGTFDVIAFRYSTQGGKPIITSVVLKNVEDESNVVVAELKYVLGLNEIFTFTATSAEEMISIFENVGVNDTITLAGDIDATSQALVLDGKTITIDLSGKNISGGNSATSGLKVKNGKVIIKDTSKTGGFVSTVDYSSTNSGTTLEVSNGGELIIGYAKMNAVREDPVNKGQFGIGVMGNGKLTIEDCDITAGWYCISGNGARTTADSKIELMGGNYTSMVDFALYLPHPGTTDIYGGTFKGAAGVITMNNGNLNIYGGYFETTGGGDTGEWSDGTSSVSPAVINVNTRYGDCHLVISGGVFKTDGESALLVAGTAHTAKIEISGGLFSSKPDNAWLANGCVCSEEPNEDGFYRVYKQS